MPHTFYRYNNPEVINFYKEQSKFFRSTEKIKYLFLCESPPAFAGLAPNSYFYFLYSSQPEVLFSTIVKAVYYINYTVHTPDKKKEYLDLLKNDGYFLIDSVEYPINKDDNMNEVSDDNRRTIILDNIVIFNSKIQELIDDNLVSKSTKTILVKHNIYDIFHNHHLLNVVNTVPIRFPYCANCADVAQAIRALI